MYRVLGGIALISSTVVAALSDAVMPPPNGFSSRSASDVPSDIFPGSTVSASTRATAARRYRLAAEARDRAPNRAQNDRQPHVQNRPPQTTQPRAQQTAERLLAAMTRQGYRLDDGVHVIAVRSSEVANGYNDRLYALDVRDGTAKLLLDEPATTDPEPRDAVYRDFLPYGGKAFVAPGQYRFRRNGQRRAIVIIGEPTRAQRGRMTIIFDTNGNNRPDAGDRRGTDAGLGIFALHSPLVYADPRDVTATGCLALQSLDASSALLAMLEPEFWMTVLTEEQLYGAI